MKNILVFPCGSEIALEIYKSLEFSTHFTLFGASSVKDHGEFIYKNYIANLPFHNDKNFIPTLKEIVKKYKIDAIYPAMDLVAFTLKQYEKELECKVIGSTLDTTKICASKNETYALFKNKIPLPLIYKTLEEAVFPIFIKPNIGYGSRNIFFAKTLLDAQTFLEQKKDVGDFVLCEYLSQEEYTIDCFSNRHGELLFYKPRQRARISNGISVNTIHTNKHKELFSKIAKEINATLKPQGAWFFQMKEDKNNKPKLLEIAARLGGSSSLCRAKGINFAQLSLFDAFDIDVSIIENSYEVELDRALDNKYKIHFDFSTIYVDYDDCIIVNEKVNHQIISFLYKAFNENKKIILITRHAGNLENSLKTHRIKQLFDKIIHLNKEQKKSTFIKDINSIFIDDSFIERKDVASIHKIPVFSPDMIEVLL